MYPSRQYEDAPEAVRALRRRARRVILAVLWLAPAVSGWLAAQGGMGWELVVALGLGVAAVAGAGRRGRVVLALCLAVAAGLVLGAGRDVVPFPLAVAVPVVALITAGALCDGRALVAGFAVLAVLCLLGARAGTVLPLVQLGALGLGLVAMLVAQRLLRRTARQRVRVLAPAVVRPGWSPGWSPCWSIATPPPMRPAVLVQAERAPDGTLRLALAAAETGRLRVTVS